ncbi:hypothetical protein [Streptomyces caniscabiei]|uniref:hypothetical protein n=1 Tax=Streptomyces caniscabiei TaxID=2746961 RepID=UPI0007658842|nr:hypothetical protein [Streptomyces caniscabiei]
MSPIFVALAAIGIAVCIVGALFCGCLLKTAVDEYRRDRQKQREADARKRAGLPPPAPDNVAGVNHADHNECAQILNATNELEAEMAAGFDRLWDAIRDHRKEENP